MKNYTWATTTARGAISSAASAGFCSRLKVKRKFYSPILRKSPFAHLLSNEVSLKNIGALSFYWKI